ncbi:hypothetical protein [Streptoalloteichus hindustanus]|uniref:Uncharacterized protein n=1 Tax=Streptoalloteichus hindustanus TaxID=2017 RepID=A0A1M5HBV4_STRHI|nr:hypothetical protein [Streptoalloteichus hindustanus]SHG13455.1 hypothetical protein SAMN05444320_106496 [Streptoalloteichus hindustanus]
MPPPPGPRSGEQRRRTHLERGTPVTNGDSSVPSPDHPDPALDDAGQGRRELQHHTAVITARLSADRRATPPRRAFPTDPLGTTVDAGPLP